MLPDDNEIYLKKFLRVFRTGMVSLIRDRLTTYFGPSAETQLSSLFEKKDEKSGKTLWELMVANAQRARATPEVSTRVDDCFELLGVSDFHNVLDKFYPVICTEPDSEKYPEKKKGLLRCVQQLKVFRDPNAHEVTEQTDAEGVELCALNCLAVAKTLLPEGLLVNLRSLLQDFRENRESVAALVISIGKGGTDLTSLLAALKLKGVEARLSSRESASAKFVEESLQEAPQNIVLVLDPHPDELLSSQLSSVVNTAFAYGVRPVLCRCPSQSQNESLKALLDSLAQSSANSVSILVVDEYIDHAAVEVRSLLLRYRVRTRTRTKDFYADVPVAESVYDGRFAAKLFNILKDPDLEEVVISSPFITEASGAESPFFVPISRLLIDAKARGCRVTVITRPPGREDYESLNKQAFIDNLRKEAIDVYVNPRLHSKIYAFKAKQDRLTWIVGSHNLTIKAARDNLETSLLGRRKLEFDLARSEVQRIRNDRQTISYEFWASRRKLGKRREEWKRRGQ